MPLCGLSCTAAECRFGVGNRPEELCTQRDDECADGRAGSQQVQTKKGHISPMDIECRAGGHRPLRRCRRDEAARVGRYQRRRRLWWCPNRTCSECSGGAPAERDRETVVGTPSCGVPLARPPPVDVSGAVRRGGKWADRTRHRSATYLPSMGGGGGRRGDRPRTSHSGCSVQRLGPTFQARPWLRVPTSSAPCCDRGDGSAQHGSGGMAPLNRFRPSVAPRHWLLDRCVGWQDEGRH